jgi:hypothetical protein
MSESPQTTETEPDFPPDWSRLEAFAFKWGQDVERACIVAWLRDHGKRAAEDDDVLLAADLMTIARDIERGAHEH